MRKRIRKIINLHDDATFTPVVHPNGMNTSNGYVVNAYNNTLATSGNDFTPEQSRFYERNFLKNYWGKQVHGQFGEKLTMPKHSGGVVNIRGLSPYPTATTPLLEGVTPAGNPMSFYYVEIPVKQYGAYTPITDIVEFASRDDIQIRDSKELGSQAGRTIEEIDREVLNGGTSVIYAPNATAGQSPTAPASRAQMTSACVFTVDLCFRAQNYLEVQDAPTIGDSYVAIIHPNVKYDVITHPKFISIMQYGHSERLLKGEIGTIGNIRFVVSTFAKVFANAGGTTEGGGTKFNLYSTLVIGEDAYKVIEIEGEGMKTIIKGFGSGGTSDPLDQRATQGWKTTHGIGITGETRMVRIESAATLNTAKADNIAMLRAREAVTPFSPAQTVDGFYTAAEIDALLAEKADKT